MTSRFDVPDVRVALDAVVADHPDRKDRRSSGNLPPRYVDGGEPACLVAVVLHRLGVSVGVLRALDREAGRQGAGIRLAESRHPVRRRFTADAWALLAFLQRGNDRAHTTWSGIRRAAFRVNKDKHPRFAYPGPWCTDENAINEEENTHA